MTKHRFDPFLHGVDTPCYNHFTTSWFLTLTCSYSNKQEHFGGLEKNQFFPFLPFLRENHQKGFRRKEHKIDFGDLTREIHGGQRFSNLRATQPTGNQLAPISPLFPHKGREPVYSNRNRYPSGFINACSSNSGDQTKSIFPQFHER